jgi:hypothetical protein
MNLADAVNGEANSAATSRNFFMKRTLPHPADESMPRAVALRR